MHIGAIDAGSDYEVELKNQGAKALSFALFWTAPAGTPGTDPVVAGLAVGASRILQGRVPAGAQRLVVDVDVEDDGGTTFQTRVTQVGGTLNFTRSFNIDVRLAAVVL
jgi:hypothetical protein